MSTCSGGLGGETVRKWERGEGEGSDDEKVCIAFFYSGRFEFCSNERAYSVNPVYKAFYQIVSCGNKRIGL